MKVKSTFSLPLLQILLLIVTTSIAAPRSSHTCTFKSKTAVEFQPIVFDASGRLILPHSDNRDGSWTFEILSDSTSSELRLSCLGEENRFKFSNKDKSLSAICDSNGLSLQTEYGNLPVEFDHLACVGIQAATALRNGTCYDSNTRICISLSEDNNRQFIEVCFNEDKAETIYTYNQIRGPLLDQSESINRPSFAEGDFYPLIDANKCYTQAEQIKTIAELLGSQALADKYVQTGKNLFLARGHLTANADGIYDYEKKATFFYINAVPQWQTFNGGNWVQLETKSRDYAQKQKINLDVYTGTFGVTTLPDVNGKPTELWLGKNSAGNLIKQLPVPKLMWKVLHDKTKKQAIAIVQYNNPYEETFSAEDANFCTSECSKVPGVNWALEDHRLGYTLCCTVENLRKSCPWAPNLGNLPLLTEF